MWPSISGTIPRFEKVSPILFKNSSLFPSLLLLLLGYRLFLYCLLKRSQTVLVWFLYFLKSCFCSPIWIISIFLPFNSLIITSMFFSLFPMHLMCFSSHLLSSSAPVFVLFIFRISVHLVKYSSSLILDLWALYWLSEFPCGSFNFFVTTILNYQLDCNIPWFSVQLLENFLFFFFLWYHILIFHGVDEKCLCHYTTFEVTKTFII